MGEIVQQSRTVLRMLLGVSLLLLWLLWEPAAHPLQSARKIVDGALLPIASTTADADPLEGLPQFMQRPLAQYRHQFRMWQSHDTSVLPDKLRELRSMPIAAVLELGERVFVEPSSRTASPLSELYVVYYRSELGQLQTWCNRAGLGQYATLGELDTALQTRITLPVIEQSVSASAVLSSSALVVLACHAYLISLLATAAKMLPGCEIGELRAWLPLHHHRLGIQLTAINLLAPTTLWIAQQAWIPAFRDRTLPSALSIAASLLLMLTTLQTWKAVLRFRRQLQHQEQHAQPLAASSGDRAPQLQRRAA